MRKTTSQLVIHYIDKEYIPSYVDALPDLFLNDSHIESFWGHLSGLEIAQKILRDGYFWPTIFIDCV